MQVPAAKCRRAARSLMPIDPPKSLAVRIFTSGDLSGRVRLQSCEPDHDTLCCGHRGRPERNRAASPFPAPIRRMICRSAGTTPGIQGMRRFRKRSGRSFSRRSSGGSRDQGRENPDRACAGFRRASVTGRCLRANTERRTRSSSGATSCWRAQPGCLARPRELSRSRRSM